MKNNLIAACLQLTSSSDIYKNLKETIDLSNKAIDKGAFLISTPEVTNIISLDRQKLKRSVFLEKDDPFLIEFTKIAKKKSVWILLGSIARGAGEVFVHFGSVDHQCPLPAEVFHLLSKRAGLSFACSLVDDHQITGFGLGGQRLTQAELAELLGQVMTVAARGRALTIRVLRL